MSVLHINKNNFESEVINSDKNVLLDFWATWCGPCQMLGPIVEEIANEYPQYKICKIDVDEEAELAQAFGIVSIPTLIVFKDGKAVAKEVGYHSKEDLLLLLNR